MPIQKFKSQDEARRSLWSDSGSAQNLRRLAAILHFWSRMRPLRFPRGVRKYRSIVEATADMDLWKQGEDRPDAEALRLKFGCEE